MLGDSTPVLQGATDQTEIGNIVDTLKVSLHDSLGVALTSTLNSGKQSLDVNVSNIISVTQSGTWTVQQGTPPWSIVGNIASGATDSGNPVKIGAIFNTTQPTVTNAQRVDLQATARGALMVATGVDAFNVNNVTGTVSLPTGAATAANQTNNLQTTQLVNSAGNAVAVKTLGSTPLAADYGLETNSLMYGLTTGGGGGYVPVKVNPSGTMETACNQSTSPWITRDESSLVDNAGFTDGSSRVTSAGFILDESAGIALTENDVAAARIDSKRAQVLVIEDTTTRGRRAGVTANSDFKTSDGLRNGGVEGALTLTTGGTAYEAKVGGSALTNRKLLTITALDDMYWGYNNTVTTSTGTPIYKNQQIIFSIDPDSTFAIWLVASGNGKLARITECP